MAREVRATQLAFPFIANASSQRSAACVAEATPPGERTRNGAILRPWFRAGP